MDAFSAQIVRFVREMPDEALLELVKQKLGVIGAAASRQQGGTLDARPAAAAKAKRSTAGATAAPASGSRAPTGPDRQAMLDAIERIVKAGSGLSASEVAKAAALPQPRVAAALKELKLGKRIFQGGDRRFARYAADARTAEQASATARKNAKGPVPRSKAPVEAPRGAKKRLAEPEAPKARSRKRGANGQAQASAAAA